MCKEWEILEYSIINSMSSSNPPLRAQESMQKSRQKDYKKPVETVDSTQCLSDTAGLRRMWTPRDCGMHRAAQVQVR